MYAHLMRKRSRAVSFLALPVLVLLSFVGWVCVVCGSEKRNACAPKPRMRFRASWVVLPAEVRTPEIVAG